MFFKIFIQLSLHTILGHPLNSSRVRDIDPLNDAQNQWSNQTGRGNQNSIGLARVGNLFYFLNMSFILFSF